MKKVAKVNISASVRKETAKRAKELADRTGVTVSLVVDWALEEYIEKMTSGKAAQTYFLSSSSVPQD